MKTLKIVLFITLAIIGFANPVHAKKVYVNETVTSMDGCKWKIVGWIDVSVEFGWPPVKINHYDIVMSGPCGKHHFSGKVFNPENDDPNVATQWDGELTNLETNMIETIEEFTQFGEILRKLENSY